MITKGYSISRDYSFYNPRNDTYTYHIIFNNGESFSIEYLNDYDKTIIYYFLKGIKDNGM